MKLNSKKVIELEEKYVQLLGYSTYTRYKHSCGGKWAGSYDYGLSFSDGWDKWISNGIKGYVASLENKIEGLQNFNEHKSELENWIKSVIEKQNLKTVPARIEFEKLYIRFGDIVFDCKITCNGTESHIQTYSEAFFDCYCKGSELFKDYAETKEHEGFELKSMQQKLEQP